MTSKSGKGPQFQFRTVSLEEILGAVRISSTDGDEGLAPIVLRIKGSSSHYRSRLLGITPRRDDVTKLGIILEMEAPAAWTNPETDHTYSIGLFFATKPYFVTAKFLPELSHGQTLSFEAELPFYDLQRRAAVRIDASEFKSGETSLKVGLAPEAPEPAPLIDLSLGGLCFKAVGEAQAKLLRGHKDTLQVELTIKDVTFRTDAKIRYVRKLPTARVAYKVGLEFENLSAHASAKLNSFLFEDGVTQLERKSSQTSRRR